MPELGSEEKGPPGSGRGRLPGAAEMSGVSDARRSGAGGSALLSSSCLEPSADETEYALPVPPATECRFVSADDFSTCPRKAADACKCLKAIG